MAALRFRCAPPVVSHGIRGSYELTINLDHSVGAVNVCFGNEILLPTFSEYKWHLPTAIRDYSAICQSSQASYSAASKAQMRADHKIL